MASTMKHLKIKIILVCQLSYRSNDIIKEWVDDCTDWNGCGIMLSITEMVIKKLNGYLVKVNFLYLISIILIVIKKLY